MPTPRVKEGFLEEEMSDVRLEGTGVHQAKIERRVLGRGDRGLQRPERMIELDWSVTERDGRNLQGAGRYGSELSFLSRWEGHTTQGLQYQTEVLRPLPKVC